MLLRGMADAARLCEDLGIPHHIVDSRHPIRREIVDYLVAGYGQGIPPPTLLPVQPGG
jgi:tRNA-specific 2-thiouridylase